MAKFTDVFLDVTREGRKIPQENYLAQGSYPIFDQGKKHIAGYTNEPNGLYQNVPAIIFGDHTRIVKYVDIPFFLGADGVKLLKAKDSEANYKYLYYALCHARIPDTGYNRHFKWLKEVDIKLPAPEEQQYIVKVLDKLNSLVAFRNRQLAKLDELVKARFVEMFGDIVETVPLSRYINELVAGKSLASEQRCPNKVLKTGAVTYDFFDPTQIKNLPPDYVPHPEHLLKTGDVIISRMNTLELVGAAAYVWKAPPDTYLPDRLWKAKLQKNAQPIFIWQTLVETTAKESIRKIACGTSGSMKNISKAGLLSIRVKRVNEEYQKQFSDAVTGIHRQKLAIQQSLDKLKTLKKSLMQKYFG